MTPTDKYARNIIAGKIISCKWVKLACQRYVNDRKRDDIYFDQAAADRVIKFFKLTPHVKGEWAGTPIKLEPWQEFIITNIFAWKLPDGTRRFKTIYLEVARKNSKSTMLAAIGLYLTKYDNEAGAEIYSAATTRDQSKVVFDIAQSMVKKSRLREQFTVYKNNIHDEGTASKFMPLSSDFNSLDGLNIHAALVDELHAHKTRDLYDVLDTGTGARRQPLMISITTAGHDKHSICREQHDYTEKVLDGLIDDDSFWGIIYCIDEEDKEDWQNEKIWIKANPNLGVSVKLRDLQDKAKKAAEVATRLNAFLQKHLNIWTESSTRWIMAPDWKACAFPFDEEKLKGRACYGGLDLSSTTDITAFKLIFPPADENEKFKILCRFWIPGDKIDVRVRRDRVPYDVWVRQGFIEATEGPTINYGFIIKQITKDAREYDLKEIVFDPWGSTMMIHTLHDMGFEEEKVAHAPRHLIEFRQGFKSMSSPTKALETMVLNKEIAHNDNPVLAWMMANTVVKIDEAENFKPDKAESTERIDGIVALIMGISRAVRYEGESIYEERGVLTI